MVKKLLSKIIRGKYANSESYVNYLRGSGFSIGDRTVIYDPRSTFIDPTRPWLINIGNDVKITRGVTILTHGYDWTVLRNVYHEMLGSSGKVDIGNNVFIGMNSTILKGVTIGNNVIIGANSLVNKDIPDNVVAVGNPIKVNMILEEYHAKRLEQYEEEAKELALEYFKKFKKAPPINILYEFYPLFLERDKDIILSSGLKLVFIGSSPKEQEQKFMNSKPRFNGYAEFLRWCGLPA